MKKWKEIIAGIGKDKLLLLAIAGILLLLCSVPDKKEEKKTPFCQRGKGGSCGCYTDPSGYEQLLYSG